MGKVNNNLSIDTNSARGSGGSPVDLSLPKSGTEVSLPEVPSDLRSGFDQTVHKQLVEKYQALSSKLEGLSKRQGEIQRHLSNIQELGLADLARGDASHFGFSVENRDAFIKSNAKSVNDLLLEQSALGDRIRGLSIKHNLVKQDLILSQFNVLESRVSKTIEGQRDKLETELGRGLTDKEILALREELKREADLFLIKTSVGIEFSPSSEFAKKLEEARNRIIGDKNFFDSLSGTMQDLVSDNELSAVRSAVSDVSSFSTSHDVVAQAAQSRGWFISDMREVSKDLPRDGADFRAEIVLPSGQVLSDVGVSHFVVNQLNGELGSKVFLTTDPSKVKVLSSEHIVIKGDDGKYYQPQAFQEGKLIPESVEVKLSASQLAYVNAQQSNKRSVASSSINLEALVKEKTGEASSEFTSVTVKGDLASLSKLHTADGKVLTGVALTDDAKAKLASTKEGYIAIITGEPEVAKIEVKEVDGWFGRRHLEVSVIAPKTKLTAKDVRFVKLEGEKVVDSDGAEVTSLEEFQMSAVARDELSLAVRNMDAVKRLQSNGQELLAKLSPLQEMAQAGFEGNKTEDFVSVTRKLAKDLSDTYEKGDFEKHVGELREAVVELKKLRRGVVNDDLEKQIAGLEAQLEAVTKLVDSGAIKKLVAQINSDGFDADTWGKWLQGEGLIVMTTIAAGVAAAAATPFSGGTSWVAFAGYVASVSAVSAVSGYVVGEGMKGVVSTWNDSIRSDFQVMLDDSNNFGVDDWLLSAGTQIGTSFLRQAAFMGAGGAIGRIGKSVLANSTASTTTSILSRTTARVVSRSSQVIGKVDDLLERLPVGNQALGRFTREYAQELIEEGSEAQLEGLSRVLDSLGFKNAAYGTDVLKNVLVTLSCSKTPGVDISSGAGVSLDNIVPEGEGFKLALTYSGQKDALLQELKAQGITDYTTAEDGTIRAEKIAENGQKVISEYRPSSESIAMKNLLTLDQGVVLKKYGLSREDNGEYVFTHNTLKDNISLVKYLRIQSETTLRESKMKVEEMADGNIKLVIAGKEVVLRKRSQEEVDLVNVRDEFEFKDTGKVATVHGNVQVPIQNLVIEGREYPGYLRNNEKVFYLVNESDIPGLYSHILVTRKQVDKNGSHDVNAFIDRKTGLIFTLMPRENETPSETAARVAKTTHEIQHRIDLVAGRELDEERAYAKAKKYTNDQNLTTFEKSRYKDVNNLSLVASRGSEAEPVKGNESNSSSVEKSPMSMDELEKLAKLSMELEEARVKIDRAWFLGKYFALRSFHKLEELHRQEFRKFGNLSSRQRFDLALSLDRYTRSELKGSDAETDRRRRQNLVFFLRVQKETRITEESLIRNQNQQEPRRQKAARKIVSPAPAHPIKYEANTIERIQEDNKPERFAIRIDRYLTESYVEQEAQLELKQKVLNKAERIISDGVLGFQNGSLTNDQDLESSLASKYQELRPGAIKRSDEGYRIEAELRSKKYSPDWVDSIQCMQPKHYLYEDRMADLSPSGFYESSVVINGKRIALTTIVNSAYLLDNGYLRNETMDGVEPVYVRIRIRTTGGLGWLPPINQQDIAIVNQRKSELFNEIKILSEHEKTEQNLREIIDKVADMEWLSAQSWQYDLGSAGIAQLKTRVLLDACGIENGQYKEGVDPNLEAFCMSLEEFKQKFTGFFVTEPRFVSMEKNNLAQLIAGSNTGMNWKEGEAPTPKHLNPKFSPINYLPTREEFEDEFVLQERVSAKRKGEAFNEARSRQRAKETFAFFSRLNDQIYSLTPETLQVRAPGEDGPDRDTRIMQAMAVIHELTHKRLNKPNPAKNEEMALEQEIEVWKECALYLKARGYVFEFDEDGGWRIVQFLTERESHKYNAKRREIERNRNVSAGSLVKLSDVEVEAISNYVKNNYEEISLDVAQMGKKASKKAKIESKPLLEKLGVSEFVSLQEQQYVNELSIDTPKLHGTELNKELEILATAIRKVANEDLVLKELGVSLPVDFKVVLLNTDAFDAFVYPSKPDTVYISLGACKQLSDSAIRIAGISHEQGHAIADALIDEEQRKKDSLEKAANNKNWVDPYSEYGMVLSKGVGERIRSQGVEKFCDTHGSLYYMSQLGVGYGEAVRLHGIFHEREEANQRGELETYKEDRYAFLRSHPTSQDRILTIRQVGSKLDYPGLVSGAQGSSFSSAPQAIVDRVNKYAKILLDNTDMLGIIAGYVVANTKSKGIKEALPLLKKVNVKSLAKELTKLKDEEVLDIYMIFSAFKDMVEENKIYSLMENVIDRNQEQVKGNLKEPIAVSSMVFTDYESINDVDQSFLEVWSEKEYFYYHLSEIGALIESRLEKAKVGCRLIQDNSLDYNPDELVQLAKTDIVVENLFLPFLQAIVPKLGTCSLLVATKIDLANRHHIGEEDMDMYFSDAKHDRGQLNRLCSLLGIEQLEFGVRKDADALFYSQEGIDWNSSDHNALKRKRDGVISELGDQVRNYAWTKQFEKPEDFLSWLTNLRDAYNFSETNLLPKVDHVVVCILIFKYAINHSDASHRDFLLSYLGQHVILPQVEDLAKMISSSTSYSIEVSKSALLKSLKTYCPVILDRFLVDTGDKPNLDHSDLMYLTQPIWIGISKVVNLHDEAALTADGDLLVNYERGALSTEEYLNALMNKPHMFSERVWGIIATSVVKEMDDIAPILRFIEEEYSVSNMDTLPWLEHTRVHSLIQVVDSGIRALLDSGQVFSSDDLVKLVDIIKEIPNTSERNILVNRLFNIAYHYSLRTDLSWMALYVTADANTLLASRLAEIKAESNPIWLDFETSIPNDVNKDSVKLELLKFEDANLRAFLLEKVGKQASLEAYRYHLYLYLEQKIPAPSSPIKLQPKSILEIESQVTKLKGYVDPIGDTWIDYSEEGIVKRVQYLCKLCPVPTPLRDQWLIDTVERAEYSGFTWNRSVLHDIKKQMYMPSSSQIISDRIWTIICNEGLSRVSFTDLVREVRELYPNYSIRRNEVISEIRKSFRKYDYGQARLLQMLWWDPGLPNAIPTTENLNMDSALQFQKGLLKMLDDYEKLEVIFYVMGVYAANEKSWSVNLIEYSMGGTLDEFRESNNNLSDTEKRAFMHSVFGGIGGIFANNDKVAIRHLCKLISNSIADHISSDPARLTSTREMLLDITETIFIRAGLPVYFKTEILNAIYSWIIEGKPGQNGKSSDASIAGLIKSVFKSLGGAGDRILQGLLIEPGLISEGVKEHLRDMQDKDEYSGMLTPFHALQRDGYRNVEMGSPLASGSIGEVHKVHSVEGYIEEDVLVKVTRPETLPWLRILERPLLNISKTLSKYFENWSDAPLNKIIESCETEIVSFGREAERTGIKIGGIVARALGGTPQILENNNVQIVRKPSLPDVIIPSSLDYGDRRLGEALENAYQRSFFLRNLGENFVSLARIDKEKGESDLGQYLEDRYGVSLSDVADIAFQTFFSSFILENCVFEDMHFGNVGIIANPGENTKVALLDFGGFMESFSKSDKALIYKMSTHIFTGDFESLEEDLYRVVFQSGDYGEKKLDIYKVRISDVVSKIRKYADVGRAVNPIAVVEDVMATIYSSLPLSPDLLTFCESLRKVCREWLPHVSEAAMQSLAMNMFQAVISDSSSASKEQGSVDAFDSVLAKLEVALSKTSIKRSDVSTLVENVLRVISNDPSYNQVLEVLANFLRDEKGYEQFINKMPEKVREVFGDLRENARSGTSLREGLANVSTKLNRAFNASELSMQEFMSVVRTLIGEGKRVDSSLYSDYAKSMRKIFDENAKGIGLQLKSILNTPELRSVLSELLDKERDSDFEEWFKGIQSSSKSPSELHTSLRKQEEEKSFAEEYFGLYDYIPQDSKMYVFEDGSFVEYKLTKDYSPSSVNMEAKSSGNNARKSLNVKIKSGYVEFSREDVTYRFTLEGIRDLL